MNSKSQKNYYSATTLLGIMIQSLRNGNSRPGSHIAATHIDIDRHLDLLEFKLSSRIWKKGDLNYCGMVVGARQADLLGFSPRSGSGSVEENDLLMLEVRGEWAE